jgi:hypothetical protein
MKQQPFPYTLDPEQIPTARVFSPRPNPGESRGVYYACPDACWREHLDAWSRVYRNHQDAPQPMPWGHCMFENPVGYGKVPYGCTDPVAVRLAVEHSVRAVLDGWDRDLTAEQLERIVNATVEARLANREVGAAPFLACIYATL